MSRRRFVLAVTGLRAEGDLVRALSRPAGPVTLARRVTDVVELLAVGGAGLADGALVAPRFPHFSTDVALRLARDGTATIGVVDAGDDPGERQLLDWGLPVVVIGPGEPAEHVVQRVLAGASPPHAQPEPDSGRLIAVTGPPGSTGRTTVAVNLAAEARGLVVDADPVAPSIGFHLGVAEGAANILAAARMGEQARLTPQGLVAMAHDTGAGHVLAGVPSADRARELRASGWEALWRAAAACGRTVVVDCGPQLGMEPTGPVASLVSRARHVVVVASPTALGVRRLLDTYPDVVAATAAPVTVVWNHVPPGRQGRAHLARLADAAGTLRPAPRVVGLPSDPAAAAASDRRPGSLAVVAPRTPLRAAIAALAAGLDLA